MKKFFTLMLMALAVNASAQKYIRIWQGGESLRIPAQDIVYGNGGTDITVAGTTYATSEVDSITVVKTVTIAYNGATATVEKGFATELNVTIDGAHVTIDNPNVSEEIEFELSGNSTNGSLAYFGDYKCKFHLNGLALTSAVGSPFNIQCGKRIDVILTDGTDNLFADAADGTHKAVLIFKGHPEFEGAGNLTITGNTRHGIDSNEYMHFKEGLGKVTVNKALGDGIHTEQYFMMEGGTLDISGTEGDGLQAEVSGDSTEIHNGQIFIKGGNIKVVAAAPDTKAIKSDSLITISGGTIDITAKGDGSRGISTDTDLIITEDDAATTINVVAAGNRYTDPVTEDEKRCVAIRVKGNLTVTGGTVTTKCTGSGSRGVKVDGYFYDYGGTVTPEPDASGVIRK